MARYCSINNYKKCLSSLNNIKDKCLKDSLFSKDFVSCTGLSNGPLDKVMVHISRIKQYKRSFTVLSTVNNSDNQTQPVNNKYMKTKVLKKDIQKLCIHLQKYMCTNKNVLWFRPAVSAVVLESSNVKTNEVLLDPIPEPPPIPQNIIEETTTQLNALGEPTLASVGLGGNSPVGLVQQAFEFLHANLGLEWWAAIAVGTLIIRLALFPLVVIAQRNAAKMNNVLPQMQAIQLKMTEARQTGNQIDAAKYAQELMIFMKEKQVNPLKNMVVPLAQMPVFVSVFMGLRGMANVPLDSLKTGGLFWFTDLTLADQYYLLPIVTSATLWATIELGTDSAKLSSQNAFVMKYVLRGLPLLILPFTFSFPGAILCYWVSSNFISLLQVGFLRIPSVREYFKIDSLQKFDPSQMPMKQKGFKEGLKESWTNMKITRELEDRQKLDQIRFQKAGKGPIVKTFKYDPTKHTEPVNSTPVNAKKG